MVEPAAPAAVTGDGAAPDEGEEAVRRVVSVGVPVERAVAGPGRECGACAAARREEEEEGGRIEETKPSAVTE